MPSPSRSGCARPAQRHDREPVGAGCFAASKVPESVIAALKKQNSDKVTVSMIKFTSNKQVTFSFTQSGFPEAYQYMMKMQ
jgi:invasion protein IalB